MGKISDLISDYRIHERRWEQTRLPNRVDYAEATRSLLACKKRALDGMDKAISRFSTYPILDIIREWGRERKLFDDTLKYDHRIRIEMGDLITVQRLEIEELKKKIEELKEEIVLIDLDMLDDEDDDTDAD